MALLTNEMAKRQREIGSHGSAGKAHAAPCEERSDSGMQRRFA